MECCKEMLDKNLVRRVLEKCGRKRDSAVCGREVSEKSYIYIYKDILRVGEKCCRVERSREGSGKSVVETWCREVLDKSFVEMCCIEVSEKSFVENCWRRVLQRCVVERVLEKSLIEMCG